MQQTFLSVYVLPASLFLIMLGMGLSLAIIDFKQVVKFPKAFFIGIVCQMLLLPIIGLIILALFTMDSPELAVGFMILTFCPGGTTSNMFTFLAKGDVALSISLTAFVSLITPFTIPIFTAWVMLYLLDGTQEFSLPVLKTILTLLLITVVPVAIGMLIKKKWPGFAQKSQKPVKIASVVILIAIIFALIKNQVSEIPFFIKQIGLPTLLLNVITMVLGFLIARGAKLQKKQQITIGLEVGIQNGTTALLITGTLLANATMTVAPAIYSLIMFGTGVLFAYLTNLGRQPKTLNPEEMPS